MRARSTVGNGSIFVVGSHFHKDGDAAGSIAFVGDVLKDRPFDLAGSALNAALDVIGGHGVFARLLYRQAQAEVGIRGAASFGCHDDLFGELGEEVAAFGILCAFAQADIMPF